MAVKTFTSGEQLTASDTNTYLANSGFQVVTPSSVTNGTLSGAQTTIGTGVASVTLNGIFSSTYDIYMITFNGGSGSATQLIRCQLGSTSTGYYGAGDTITYAAGSRSSVIDSNAAYFSYAASSSPETNQGCMMIYGPNLADRTGFSSQIFQAATTGYYMAYGGYQNSDTSFTAATFSVAGTMTGGTINVYGMRKG